MRGPESLTFNDVPGNLAMASAAQGSASFQAHYVVLGTNGSSYALATDPAGNVFIAATTLDASGIRTFSLPNRIHRETSSRL